MAGVLIATLDGQNLFLFPFTRKTIAADVLITYNPQQGRSHSKWFSALAVTECVGNHWKSQIQTAEPPKRSCSPLMLTTLLYSLWDSIGIHTLGSCIEAY